MPPAPERAVFLSYASQDADAARRICETLRASGVEVWFDQSELRGGDAWDAKIRQQIKTCALFAPVISANTQARLEGYFRLEWKLAAQRTHSIADGMPFLVPIVIDETRDDLALVPEEFRAVQWTRLSGGATSAEFCARIINLLAIDSDVLVRSLSAAPMGATRPPAAKPADAPPSAPSRRRRIALAATFAILAAGAGYYFGIHAPEQQRRTELAALEAQKKSATEQAERQRMEAEQQKKLADAAAEAERRRVEAAAAEAARLEQQKLFAEQQKALADQQRAAAARGGIIVRTTPMRAEVTVGALDHGPGPLTVRNVPLGKYPVTVRLDGYVEQRLEAEVKENEFTTLDVALVRVPGATAANAAAPAIAAAAAPAREFVPTPGPKPALGQPWENSLGMKFAPVPGTTVLFGVWDVRVQDYEVFARVTQRAWRTPAYEQGPTHPAVFVSWDDANAFCAWLTELERRAGRLATTQSYRLPQDWEWSVAAGLNEPRSGTPASKHGLIKNAFPWGASWPPPSNAGNFAGEESGFERKIAGYNDGFPRTSPVGSFAPNRSGLYDMSGNVWQWCADFVNGTGPARVMRGASFNGFNADILSLSTRPGTLPANTGPDLGFRCVVDFGAAAR